MQANTTETKPMNKIKHVGFGLCIALIKNGFPRINNALLFEKAMVYLSVLECVLKRNVCL